MFLSAKFKRGKMFLSAKFKRGKVFLGAKFRTGSACNKTAPRRCRSFRGADIFVSSGMLACGYFVGHCDGAGYVVADVVGRYEFVKPGVHQGGLDVGLDA